MEKRKHPGPCAGVCRTGAIAPRNGPIALLQITAPRVFGE